MYSVQLHEKQKQKHFTIFNSNSLVYKYQEHAIENSPKNPELFNISLSKKSRQKIGLENEY